MIVRWLGTVDYMAAWKLQDELAEIVSIGMQEDTLLLLEHPPTITLGRGSDPRNLLASSDQLRQLGVRLHEVDRGGDVTYHGPGQLVGYPIFNLSRHGRDLHRFLREIESTLIELLAGEGIAGRTFPPHTGVWIEDRKVAAIGIKVRRWVSTHGFALNVHPNMSHFRLIVPCGIRDFLVTSIHMEVRTRVTVPHLLSSAARLFQERFTAGLDDSKAPVDFTVESALSAESCAIWSAGQSL